jgi:hypothetical protein
MAKIILTEEPSAAWGGGTPHHSLVYPLWERIEEWMDENGSRESLFDSLHAFLNNSVPYTVSQED